MQCPASKRGVGELQPLNLGWDAILWFFEAIGPNSEMAQHSFIAFIRWTLLIYDKLLYTLNIYRINLILVFSLYFCIITWFFMFRIGKRTKKQGRLPSLIEVKPLRAMQSWAIDLSAKTDTNHLQLRLLPLFTPNPHSNPAEIYVYES